MNTNITYGKSEDAWNGYNQFITGLIDTHNIKSICDIGGGANPFLDAEYINRKSINYSVLDISETEMAKAPEQYNKIHADITLPEIVIEKQFDLVFSKMLAEHVDNAEQFHKNVLTILNSGGMAVHFFPTLYAFPFLVNRLVPERLAEKLLRYFSPRDEYQTAKFPAYYQWCRGPVNSQVKKFTNLGYEIIEYKGFFGHPFYYNRIPFIRKLHEIKTAYLLKHPHPLLSSYAYVVLRKP